MNKQNKATFTFNNQPIRVVWVDGTRWIVGPDICKAFGLVTQWGSARYRRFLNES